MDPPLCADCSQISPSWASLQRGVLLCRDCCHVHRNLGRHISQVRSLNKGVWHGRQLELVRQLHAAGANHVWEHGLVIPHDTANPKHKSAPIKKPIPSDPVYPVKETFIRAKYVDEKWIAGSDQCTDLNQQLFSCVRTQHVETTLRLLAWGADPNYADPQSGSTPLHVAAHHAQPLQAELLAIYGADPTVQNVNGTTPSQAARQKGENDLAHRLDELVHEVTDRFSFFLCQRRPDHSKGLHYLIPELAARSSTTTGGGLRLARHQLTLLSDPVFERLVQDCYDEVDRREVTASWDAEQLAFPGSHQLASHCVAVFLPANPQLSATRNQMRQKLAKYDVREFATLLIDVMEEIRRRALGLQPPPIDVSSLTRSGRESGSHQDYDEVDCSLVAKRVSSATRPSTGHKSSEEPLNLNGRGSSGNNTNGISGGGGAISRDDYLELRERMDESDKRFAQLAATNQQLLKMLSSLTFSLEKTREEQAALNEEIRKLRTENAQTQTAILKKRLPSPGRQPIPAQRSGSSDDLGVVASKSSSNLHQHQQQQQQQQQHHVSSSSGAGVRRHVSLSTSAISGQRARPAAPLPQTPLDRKETDELIAEVERLTAAIRLFLADEIPSDAVTKRAPEHAHQIGKLVQQIICVVPGAARATSRVDTAIAELVDSTARLSARCNAPTYDHDRACTAAYAVAKSAKTLLTTIYN